jgi:hypothetical protein
MFFFYFDFQWSLMLKFKFFSFSDVSKAKEFVEFIFKLILRLERFLIFKEMKKFEIISFSLISISDFFKKILITSMFISMKSSMHFYVKIFQNYSTLIFTKSSSKFVKNTLIISSKIIAFISIANELIFCWYCDTKSWYHIACS